MSRTLEYLPVGCLGKLPFEREHLRVNHAYATARRLDGWIDAGRRAALLDSGENRAQAREAVARRFLIHDLAAPELLAGILRPSQDLERRAYPFALFAPVPRSLYGRHFALVPLGLEPVWEGIEDLWRVLSTAATRHAFHEVISDASVPAPMAVAEARSRYEIDKSESVGRLFERADGASLAALEGSWGDLLARLKKTPSRGAGPCVELPVSRSLRHSSFDASFWLDLLNRQFLLKRFEPTFFVDARNGEADRDLLLVFGELTPEEYPWVLGSEAGSIEVARPARRPPGETAPGAQSPPDLSFAGLLARKLPTSV